MSRPDVRWAGVSHQQIVDWVRSGRGARATQTLESRLTTMAEALARTGDNVNSVLQRVNAGEWTGAAATLAARAMQVMRDFDDTTGHYTKMNNLAAYGQSDNAGWARSNVPPLATIEPPVPTGKLRDLLDATRDYNDQLKAAKDAEERARQVMRDYQSMSETRVTALPPIPPVPKVVATDAPATIVVPSGDDARTGPARADPGQPAVTGPVRPGGDAPRAAGPGESPGTVGGPGGAGASGSRPQRAAPQPGSGARGPQRDDGAGGGPQRGDGAGPVGPQRSGGARPGGGSQRGGGAGPGGPQRGSGVGDGAQRGGGQPGAPRAGEPNARGQGGARAVGGSATRGGTPGVAPIGVGRGESDEDREHRVKYGVPVSEIFEPDNDDGLLYDPYRPGSYVAPATIGDDEDE